MDQYLILFSSSVKQAMRQMNKLGTKQVFVVDEHKKLVGALSDGDIRKWILKEGGLEAAIDLMCNKSPFVVSKNYDLEEVKAVMLDRKIEAVPVIDNEGCACDILNWDVVFAGKEVKYKETFQVPVVIMAGGKGTRLDPFTKVLPKPLIPVGDKPIVEMIMDKFFEYGIKDFYMTVFYKARMIKSYFEEANGKYCIKYIEEKKPLGTVGSLSLLKGHVHGDFIVINGDVVIDSDYAELLHLHRQKGYDLTMVVSYRHYQIPYGVCELGQGGALKVMKEKPEYDFLVNAGMYVMKEHLLGLIPTQEPFNINQLITKMKEQKLKIGVFPISEKSWLDVGQWEEYYKSIQHLKIDLHQYEP